VHEFKSVEVQCCSNTNHNVKKQTNGCLSEKRETAGRFKKKKKVLRRHVSLVLLMSPGVTILMMTLCHSNLQYLHGKQPHGPGNGPGGAGCHTL